MKAPFLISLLFSSSLFAMPETIVLQEMMSKFEKPEFCAEKPSELVWKRRVVETPLNAYKNGSKYRLRYSKFGCNLGNKGSIVIAPGRSEGSPEYYETALDFMKAGYGPIYVIDHRGQGLSPRRLQNTNKGHVENFENYVSDLVTAMEDIQSDLEVLGFRKGEDHLFYTSNSMGAGIGLGYFEKIGKENPFTAAALLGGMIRVNYLSFIGKEPSFLNNRIYSEEGVIAQGLVNCLTKEKCGRYARPNVFGDYKPGTRQFIEKEDIKEMEKFMTHSKARYDLRTYLWDNYDWSKIIAEEYSGENWKGPALGGSTFSWTLYTTKFLKKMRKKSFIKNLPDMPILIQTGSRDLRAYRPHKDGSTDLSRHSEFCQKINKHNSHSKNLCTMIELKDGFHELYKESDEYRDEAMENVLKFFAANS